MSECADDKDMLSMATDEMGQAKEEERRLQNLLMKLLLPKDDADERDCILEVRAGKLSLLKMEVYYLCSSKTCFYECLLTCLRSRWSLSCLFAIVSTRFLLFPFSFVFAMFLQAVVERRLPCLQWISLKCKVAFITRVQIQKLCL